MNDIEAKLAALRLKFISRCGERADALDAALASGDRKEITSVAHGISGTAGLFGFGDIGRQAAALEAAMHRGEDGKAEAEALRRDLRQLAESNR